MHESYRLEILGAVKENITTYFDKRVSKNVYLSSWNEFFTKQLPSVHVFNVSI